MKITLDLPSVLTGGAVALVLGLVAGFTPQVTQVPGATNVAPRQITGQFSPHPSDLVWLEALAGSTAANGYDSQLLTVPAGKILVLTGLSSSNGALAYRLSIDGQLHNGYLRTGDANDGVATGWNRTFSTGVPLTEGQTVQLLRYGTNQGALWLHGYWADA